MRTVEIEHADHEDRYWAQGRLAPLRGLRFMQSEDTVIATLASWTVGLLIFTLAGFYFGTVAGHDNHPANGLRHVDLNQQQIGIVDGSIRFQGAVPYAVGGLLLGILFALIVTFVYVPAKLRELDQEGVGH